ncbi:MAG: tetratricopeptide repeat protein, partial [Micromonosporaceae bacterium]|nr:tetratricopeptide repeat protein [Micromonosporaceae bacterium]
MSGQESTTQFHVLGPLSVHLDGRRAAVPAPRSRVVLAMLLLHAGRTVSMDQLAEAVWSSAPPRSARNQIQTCVSQLRRQLTAPELDDVTIGTEPAGYRLQVDPAQVDAHRFRELVTEARRTVASEQHKDAREYYRSAVGLWRGPALAGIDSDLVRELADALDEERAQALEECLEVELALGGAGELVGELTELVRRYPYRERLRGALMRALYRAGRPADALAAYRQARKLFQDELGTDPGEELQRLHQAILSRDPELHAPPEPVPPAPGVRELPVEASCFVGRTAELARVRGILAPPGRETRRRPPVAVLYGPGGTGKSALAVRAAHELADQFPDGQLYVDLCGSTPGIRPVPAIEVLGRFLRRLGVHPSQVPSVEAEAAAMFRSLTADRRLLLLLDNAVDKDQIAALMPGTPASAVLITSRHPLPTLDADDRIRLGALPDPDGLALLAGLTGRLAAEPDAATADIVDLCGGLPLAIRIAAGRLASRPDIAVAEYARRLADRSRRLDELQLDDLAVRASIRTSYDALLAGGGPSGRLAARAFRMLGLLQVPDVAPLVVAAMLAELDAETARTALDRLVDAQLVEPVAGGRYRLHDLVRLVAAERAVQEESTSERDEAIYRAIAFYTITFWQAARMARPSRAIPFGAPPAIPLIPLHKFADVSSASGWIDVELPSLETALAQATSVSGATGRLVLWLGDALWDHLDLRCEWNSALRASYLMVELAGRAGDRELGAIGCLLYGRSQACLGSFDAAITFLERALDSARYLENKLAIALILNGLGVVHEWADEPETALSSYEEALELLTSERRSSLASGIRNNIVVSYTRLGRLDRAAAMGELNSTHRGLTDCVIQAASHLNLAAVYCLSGDQVKAVRAADLALELSQGLGDRRRQCEELTLILHGSGRGRCPSTADRLYSMGSVAGWGSWAGCRAGGRGSLGVLPG